MKRTAIQKLQRKLGVKPSSDPDGVLAVLQIARRLYSEGDTAIYSVLDDALSLAAPKDKALAWWAAHRALHSCMPEGHLTLGSYATDASEQDVLAWFDAAIKRQGTMNVAVRKGKWNK